MQANAQKVQRRMIKPRTPAQTAADVVERVVATDGEDYLETRQSKLSWWQLSMLDVKLFLGVAIFAIVGLLGIVMWVVCKVLLKGALRMVRRAPPQSHSWKRQAV